MSNFDSWLDDLTERVREKSKADAEPHCDTCDDTGICMTMVCYGGPPVERLVYCVDCERGNGPRGQEVSDTDRFDYLSKHISMNPVLTRRP